MDLWLSAERRATGDAERCRTRHRPEPGAAGPARPATAGSVPVAAGSTRGGGRSEVGAARPRASVRAGATYVTSVLTSHAPGRAPRQSAATVTPTAPPVSPGSTTGSRSAPGPFEMPTGFGDAGRHHPTTTAAANGAVAHAHTGVAS